MTWNPKPKIKLSLLSLHYPVSSFCECHQLRPRIFISHELPSRWVCLFQYLQWIFLFSFQPNLNSLLNIFLVAVAHSSKPLRSFMLLVWLSQFTPVGLFAHLISLIQGFSICGFQTQGSKTWEGFLEFRQEKKKNYTEQKPQYISSTCDLSLIDTMAIFISHYSCRNLRVSFMLITFLKISVIIIPAARS